MSSQSFIRDAKNWVLRLCMIVSLSVFFLLLSGGTSSAAFFACRGGDVACLVNAIRAANATGSADAIFLGPGVFNLTAVEDIYEEGGTALPSIMGPIIIIGYGPGQTIIQRDPTLDPFFDLRIFHVAESSTLWLHGVTVTKGRVFFGGGAGVFNRGNLFVTHSALSEHFTSFDNPAIANIGGYVFIGDSFVTDNIGFDGNSGAVYNEGGRMDITSTTFTRNCGESSGALSNANGVLNIGNSSFFRNSGAASGGAIINAGTMSVTNTTIVDNHAESFVCALSLPLADGPAAAELWGAGGIYNVLGTLEVKSSTIARNTFDPGFFAVTGGIINFEGATTTLKNSIVALNQVIGDITFPADCAGVITSNGNNLIGTTSDCDINLQPSDLLGDPGLGVLTDNGRPGQAHVPLLATSQAISAGDDCPPHDQLGNHRHGHCDIGAVEFRRPRPNFWSRFLLKNLDDR